MMTKATVIGSIWRPSRRAVAGNDIHVAMLTRDSAQARGAGGGRTAVISPG